MFLRRLLARCMSSKHQHSKNFRSDFETFKSNVCHKVKDLGDLPFIIKTLESDQVRTYFNKKWYPESLYLLAMTDYLSRENNLPLCTVYDDIRACKLSKTIYPSSVIVFAAATNNPQFKTECFQSSIPEFKRFNIVENEVRNVY